MDTILEKYADLILKSALKIKRGDLLTINTEEENLEFAHIISSQASSLSGNGVFINTIEEGKIISTEESNTDFPITKRPSLLLHLESIKKPREYEFKEYSAKELQEYKLLAEPLDNPEVAIPYASVPSPSLSWGEEIYEGGSINTCLSILDDLFLLEENYLELAKERESITKYQENKFNKLNLKSGRVTDENGTDLSFSFLPDSVFASMNKKTTDGRLFIPPCYSSSIFRALDYNSVNGYLTITRPILLFNKKIEFLNLTFVDGKVTEISSDDETIDLFKLYLSQDKNSSKASMLSFTDSADSSFSIDYFAFPEWDRERCTSLTLGAPKPEGILNVDKANDSLVSLALPIGSDKTQIECTTGSGDNILILEDGIIIEED